MKSKIYLILLGLALTLNLAGQNFTTMIYENWENGAWKNYLKQTNTLDSKGNITKSVHETWNATSSAWEKNAQTTYTLNANSTVASTLTQTWNKNSGIWEDSQKAAYTYDPSGKNLLTLKTSIYLVSIWMDNSLTTNTYNSSNQLTQSLGQTWDMLTSTWKNSYQMVYTFNADGTDNQDVHKMWNTTSNAWENQSRTTYTYDGSKRMIGELLEDYTAGNWKNDYKYSFMYNTDNTLKEGLGQQWDMGTNGWMDDSKEFYTYQNGNQTQLLIQEWSNSQWKNAARISYTYGITAITQTILPAGENIVVYPNPSKGEITISGNTASVSNISIFDQEGRLVRMISRGESLTGINLNGLSNGIYFIQAGKPGNGQGARFVLQK